jgi:hypothetical protein
MSYRPLLGVLAAVLSLVITPCAQADGRPPDAGGTVCTYRVPEAVPYDTPQGHIRVHYVTDPADSASPVLTSTRVAGVPDWVVSAGEMAEDAWARETAMGFPAPPADNADGAERGGDARYDLYVCDVAAQGLGELATTVADPLESGFSYIVVDNDYAPGEVAPLVSSGLTQLRVSIAHELFHAIQIGESRGGLPEWMAEATAVWMEGNVASPDVDREIYRVALGGAGTEQPYWSPGGLHEYGAWWLIDELEGERPGFVRRLLTLAAAREQSDPYGLQLLARAFGGRGALETAFVRFARTAVDDPLVGPALRARRTARLRPGGRLVLRASVQPLSFRLWRVPTGASAVTVRRSGALGLAAVVRRGRGARVVPRGGLKVSGGQGSLFVLVIGGAGSVQDVRLTLKA